MKKMRNLKLSLNRETLAPLTDDSLDQVNGGYSVGGPSLPVPPKTHFCQTRMLCPPPPPVSQCNSICVGTTPTSIPFKK